MLVKRFLAWIQSAPAEARAGATAALARAWLGSDLGAFEKVDAAAALTLMLDDPDVGVRQALAEVFADAEEAPRHIVFALASDVAEVALPVLRRSPLLGDSDLVEWVATRGLAVQCAIAGRRPLAAPVAAALAEVGEPDALAMLAANPDARLPGFSLARMAERHAADPAVARALLGRADLDPVARFCLLSADSDRLSGEGGPSREAQERAVVMVAASLGEDGLGSFVRELRGRGLLTASLLLRALAMGEADLFEAVLAELSGLPAGRVAAIAAERRGAGFPALCRKIGLPAPLVPVLRSALAVVAEVRQSRAEGLAGLHSPSWILARIMETDAVGELGEGNPVAAALARLSAEFAREEGRRLALSLAPPARVDEEPLLLETSMMVAPAPMALGQDNHPPAIGAGDWALADGSSGADGASPSYGAMAALLEETVAAALANLPPPQPPRDEREQARRAPVIEGEWVGVAVDQGFDPGQFRVDVAA